MKLVLLVLALAACAPAETVFKPVPVDIPVEENCNVAAIAAPDFALKHAARGDLFAKVKAALIELQQRRSYEAQILSQSICS